MASVLHCTSVGRPSRSWLGRALSPVLTPAGLVLDSSGAERELLKAAACVDTALLASCVVPAVATVVDL